MAYVEPSAVTTGTVMTATRWNQDVVNNTLALYNTPGVLMEVVGSSFVLTALQAENTLIPFTENMIETYNNNVTVDSADYKLVAQVAGVYAVCTYAYFAPSNNANNGTLYIQSSDGQIIAAKTFQHPAVVSYSAFMSVMGTKKLAAGDSVQFYVRQNLAASLQYYVITLGMHWIGSGS